MEEKLDKIVRMHHQNFSLGNYIVVEPQGQDMVDLNSFTIFNRSLSTMLQNKKKFQNHLYNCICKWYKAL